MRGLEAWVTTAVDDKDVAKVLVLARSLRRAMTTKYLLVVASPSLESKNRGLLKKGFDQVLSLDYHDMNGWIGIKDYAMLYCFNLTLFTKCVYLAPSTLVLKNCDEVFDLPHDFAGDTSVLCFIPKTEIFEHLIVNGKKFVKEHGGHFDTYMKSWLLNQKKFGKLDSKYNVPLFGETLPTGDISIAKIPIDVSEKMFLSGSLQCEGIMEAAVANYWRKLYEQDDNSDLLNREWAAAVMNSTCDDSTELLNSIAIVGISCRHAGANNFNEFSDLLLNGKSGIRTVPTDRWTKEHGSKVTPAYENTQGGFLSRAIDEFDAKLFGISPKEMEYLDPQHRLLLEESWKALENAGIDPFSLRKSHTGVFVGAWMNDYKDLMSPGSDEFFRGYMGNSFGAAAARLSFFFGFTGPSVATESGCSSAMQSVDLACKSLRAQETSLALACGVNLLLRPYNKGTMAFIISDGYCRTFSDDADGFGRGEGCGVLVLKRYADAVKDGDNIWALIRGSSCVQEGTSKSMGTPTKECEALAMRLALADAGVHPKDVSMIEAHGTGTPLGDPLEISAIAEVYGGGGYERDQPLVIGSVKTNVGHTESCSGITGIAKIIASLQKEVIPPHLNMRKLNPKINLEVIPAIIPLEPIAWPRNDKPRIAGVSSFGITGTDGHVIIQEAPDTLAERSFFDMEERSLHIMKLSAKTEEALDDMLAQYQQYLEDQEDSSFPDICYTANSGRASFPYRAVVIAKSCKEASKMLQAKKYSKSETIDGSPRKICFLFTGQGSQYLGMSKQLYETSPIFRMNFDKCDKILQNTYNISIRNALWESEDKAELSRSIYSQISIFCIEYCLFQLWGSWGIKPDYVLGHSLGEFCAAVAAKILSFEDALKLVAERSRLIDSLDFGSMLVIKANMGQVERLMKESQITELDFAAVNSPEQTVVAGDTEKIHELLAFCKEKEIKCVLLEATHAFHSRHMDSILEEYRKIAETVKILKTEATAGNVKFISGMEGDLTNDLTADYWIRHTREKVNFIDACKVLRKLGVQDYLEVGPQPVLSALVIANTESNGESTTCIPSIRRNEENWKTMLGALAKLYVSGWSINWKGFDQHNGRSVVPTLPTYPFQRKKYWFEPRNAGGFLNNGEILHPLLGCNIPIANASCKIFQNPLDVQKRVAWIKDHCVGKRIIFPAAAFLEACLSAGHCVTEGLTDTFSKPSGPLTIENLRIIAPLALDENLICHMQVVLHSIAKQECISDDAHDGMKIQVFKQYLVEDETPKWTEHCVSYFTPAPVNFDEFTFRASYNLGRIKNQCDNEVGITDMYGKLAEVGLKFGTSFQSLTNLWTGKDGVLAEIKVPEYEKDYIVHPVLMDGMLQTAMMVQSKGQIDRLHVPIAIKKFTWLQNDDESGAAPVKYFIYSSVHRPTTCNASDSSNELISVLYSGNEKMGNKIVAFMIGMEFAETTVQAIESNLDSQKSDLPTLYNEVWKPQLGPNQARVSIWEIFKDEVISQELVDLFQESNVSHPDVEREDLFQKLCYDYILKAFYELSWEPRVGGTFLQDTFMKDLQISSQHKKLVRYYMTLLVDDGILKFIGEAEWEVIKMPPSLLETKQRLKSTKSRLEQFENLWNSVQIYDACGSNYAAILQGKSSALPILFPQDPTKPSAASFYTESYRYSGMDINTVKNFKTLLKPHDPNNRGILRILEVGAGTGNFTRDILRIFQEHGVGIEYTFTDISPAFFINAAKKFEDFKDVIKYQVLNVEYDAKLQGFSPQYFDLVVGADVFHATKSLSDSINNVRQLLRPEGILCLIEGARQSHITCIFGLLEGYWRFVDTDIRQHHPLVSGDTWKNLLLNQEFDKVLSIPCFMDYYVFIMARASKIEPRIMRPITYSTGGKWLVFPTLDNESKHLIHKLSLYRPVITVWKSFVYQESEDGTGFGINVNQKDHMTKMMETVRKQSSTSHIEGILYLWGLSAGVNADQADIAQPFLNLCQAIVEMKQQQVPKFFLITQGIHSIGDHPCENPAGSTLWGIAKSCANELNMKIKMIDICPSEKIRGPQAGLETANDIFYELWNENADLLMGYREKTRYFGKLMKTKLAEKALKLPQSDRFQLILPQTKSISDLKFGTLGKYSLKPDEIEVRVKSCALNFRDVFAVLKPEPQFDSINVIGSDFAGIVSSVGSQVTKWQIGDSVFGCNLENGALCNHVRITEDAVVRKPESWTYAEACGLPAVFATAYYSLVTVAKMKAGDTVLIHTASGGVGLSAIQICQQIGAKVIATAGSSRKRAYLKNLGIRHVFHSRNTNYEHDIMQVTNGRGVDIVLNSLTGPGFKEASLNICKQGAKFVEMSKLSVFQPDEVRKLRPDVEYTIVDLTSVSRNVWTMLFKTLDDFLKQGKVIPIRYVGFQAVFIREALGYLQKAQHIGKVVCIFPEIKFQSGQYTHQTPLFNPESTYLITGGLGGIGFEVCKWMVHQGATNIVLVNRSLPKEKHMQVIKAFRAQNKNIQTMQADIGDPIMCKNLLENIHNSLPPLRGIMHAAGTLSDATLINQTWEKYLQTFRSKVKGAWNLHELTKNLHGLECFISFSSMAALFGPPGQSNHSAGNCYLDALTCYRDSIGLPATTVNWGQWGQVGVAAGREVRGVVAFSPARGIAALEAIMKSQKKQMCVVDLDYQVILKIHPQSKAYMQYLAVNGSSGDSSGPSSIKSETFWEEVDCAKNEDKPKIVKHYIKVLLRQILKLEDEEPIDDNANFQDMGLDSLMMIELKNNLQTILGSRMTFGASALSECNNIELLSDKLIEQLNELSDADKDQNDHVSETKLDLNEMWKLVEEDSKLPKTIQFENVHKVPKLSEASVFLLTGVTGNLGPYLLQELLKYEQVKKVYCLVRKTLNPHQRINQILNEMKIDVDQSKLKLIVGDLMSTKFGLDDGEWNSLSHEIDAVIHCAVKSNHVQQYGKNAMREMNVFGTMRVLEFCGNQKTKHLFHCSSIVAVSSTDEDGCLSEGWPRKGELEGVTDLGYLISKMICDRLVHQAVIRGLPAKSFRFGGLIGNSESGRFKHHNNHIMLRFLCYMKLGAMPSVPIPAFLLPVNLAAAESVKIFFDNNAPSDVYNLCHPHPALEQEFPALAKEFGFEIDVVEYNEFVNRFSNEGVDSPLYPFRELYQNEEMYTSLLSFPEVIRKWLENPDNFFSVRKVSKIIPDYAARLLPTWDYVRNDLKYAKSVGLFEKFKLTT